MSNDLQRHTLDQDTGVELIVLDGGPLTVGITAPKASLALDRTNSEAWLSQGGGAWTKFGLGAVSWASITGKPTDIAGFGITDAWTKTQSDARYVYKAGDTMTGPLLNTSTYGWTLGETSGQPRIRYNMDATGAFELINASDAFANLFGQTFVANANVQAGIGSNGQMRMSAGGPSNIGYIEWSTPAAVRQGYMGYGASGITLQMEVGNFKVVGSAGSGFFTVNQDGDIRTSRSAGATGVLYFGVSSTATYLYFDGTNYLFGSSSAALYVGGYIALTAGNYQSYAILDSQLTANIARLNAGQTWSANQNFNAGINGLAQTDYVRQTISNISTAGQADALSHNATTFAYSGSGTPAPGALISFGGFGGGYETQINGNYLGDQLYYRSKNGDTGVWHSWQQVAALGLAQTFTADQTFAGNIYLPSGIIIVPYNTGNFDLYSGGTAYGGFKLSNNVGAGKGYLYWDSSGFGLLNNTGNFSLRLAYGSGLGGTLFGAWSADTTFTAPAMGVSGASAQYGFQQRDGTTTWVWYATGSYAHLYSDAYGDVINVLKNGGGGTLLGSWTVAGYLIAGAYVGGAPSIGDIITRRAANTGVLWFGDSLSRYLYFDGTTFQFAGGGVTSGTYFQATTYFQAGSYINATTYIQAGTYLQTITGYVYFDSGGTKYLRWDGSQFQLIGGTLYAPSGLYTASYFDTTSRSLIGAWSSTTSFIAGSYLQATTYILAGAYAGSAPSAGDIVARRSATTGYFGFGDTPASKYLYYDATDFRFVGGKVYATDFVLS